MRYYARYTNVGEYPINITEQVLHMSAASAVRAHSYETAQHFLTVTVNSQLDE